MATAIIGGLFIISGLVVIIRGFIKEPVILIGSIIGLIWFSLIIPKYPLVIIAMFLFYLVMLLTNDKKETAKDAEEEDISVLKLIADSAFWLSIVFGIILLFMLPVGFDYLWW